MLVRGGSIFSTFTIIVSNMFCRSIVKLPPPIVEEVAVDPAVNVKLSPSIATTVLLVGVDPWKLILSAGIPPVEAAPKIFTTSPICSP